jgi:hypothetical protein
LLAFLGMVTGTSLDYGLGRLGLQSVLSRTRFAPALEPRLSRAERFLERWGVWAFLLAHFVGHVRSFLAITAGMTQLPVRRFLLYEGTAALIWNLIFVGLGYALGGNLDRLQHLMSRAGIAIGIAASLGYVVYRVLQRRRAARHVAALCVPPERALTSVSDGRPSVSRGVNCPAHHERSPGTEDSMDELFDHVRRQQGTNRRYAVDPDEGACLACDHWDAPIDEDDPFCPECGRQFETVEDIRRRRRFWELMHDEPAASARSLDN